VNEKTPAWKDGEWHWDAQDKEWIWTYHGHGEGEGEGWIFKGEKTWWDKLLKWFGIHAEINGTDGENHHGFL